MNAGPATGVAAAVHAPALVFAALRAVGLLFGVLALGWPLAFLLAVIVIESWIFLLLAAGLDIGRDLDSRKAWSAKTIAMLALQIAAAALFYGLLLGALAALMADMAMPGGRAWNELRDAWVAERGWLVLAVVFVLELVDAVARYGGVPRRSEAGTERNTPLAFWRVLLIVAIVAGVAQLAPAPEDSRTLIAIGVAVVLLVLDGLPHHAARLLRLHRR